MNTFWSNGSNISQNVRHVDGYTQAASIANKFNSHFRTVVLTRIVIKVVLRVMCLHSEA